MVNKTSSTIGIETETIACEYLCSKGLTIVCRNFLTPRGEIDIVMRDRNQLVFVEVRYRSSTIFGSAESSITRHKIQKLRAASSLYVDARLSQRFCVRVHTDGICGACWRSSVPLDPRCMRSIRTRQS